MIAPEGEPTEEILGCLEGEKRIFVLACGAGIQADAAAVDRPVHPGTNSVSVGGLHCRAARVECESRS